MDDIVKAGIEAEIANRTGPPKRSYHGCCGPCKWFCESPLKRWRYGIFFVWACLNALWIIMYFSDPLLPTAQIIASLVLVVISMWALCHFRILTKLTEQVEKLYRLNKDFLEENRELRKDVVTLAKTEQHLSSIQGQLGRANEKLKQNILKFQKLDANLRTISDSNIKGVETLQKKSRKVMDSMQSSLVRHEKNILHAVYDALEWKNNMKGLSEHQFEMFWKKLPSSYYKRWLQTDKSFDDIADENGILCYKQFTKMCDEFAYKEALSGGSKEI